MFRRSVHLKSSGGLVVKVTMANNSQGDSYAQRGERGHRGGSRWGNRGRGGDGHNSEQRGGFPSPPAKSSDTYGRGPVEGFSKGFHGFEASKDNRGQGSQYSNDGSGQNYGNNSRQNTQPGCYPRNEMRTIGRGQRHTNDSRQRTQPGLYQKVSQRGDRTQGHRQEAQPDPYQADSQKADRAQGNGQWAQPGPNQGDSQKGDMAQSDSQKGDMAQGHGQWAEPDSYQGDSQEGSGGVQAHGQGAQPGFYQGDSQEYSDRGQRNGNNSRQDMGHGQGAQPGSYKGNSQEGNAMGQRHANDSRQRAQPGLYQKNSQRGDRTQGHGQEAQPDPYQADSQKADRAQGNGQWAQPGPNQGDSQKGDMAQSDSQKGDMAQGHGQWAEPDSYQGDSQEGSGGVQAHGQGAQPGFYQGDSQEYSDRGQGNGNNSRQDMGHGQGAQPGSYKGNSQEGNAMGQRHANFDQQQRKRNRVDDEDDMYLSKTLSFILRHGAEKLKFKLMPGGFLYVDEILKKMQKLEGFTEEDVKRIVAQNDKQRFALQKDGGTGRLKIRANQGHTVEVEDLELTKIESEDQAPVVLHGTYYDAWNSIKTQGLCRFKRNHIHFAAGEPGENGVISGMRSSCQVLIYIDLEKALKDGLNFYLSANNVILSPGNEKGYIYPCYFKAVLNRYPFDIIQFDPNIKGTTVSADQIADELDQKDKKKKKHKKIKEDRENNESGAPGEEIEGVGDTNLFDVQRVVSQSDKHIFGLQKGHGENMTEYNLGEHGAMRDSSEELLSELTLGSADAEDETEPYNQDQGGERMKTPSESPTPTFKDKIEEPSGPSPLWPVSLEHAPGYNQHHLDSNNFFLGAPSSVLKSHAATVLQRVRGRALCQMEGRKVEFAIPDGAACVIKRERCVLPDGSIYELTSTLIPDPEFKEKKEQPSQTEENIKTTMETGIQCDIIEFTF